MLACLCYHDMMPQFPQTHPLYSRARPDTIGHTSIKRLITASTSAAKPLIAKRHAKPLLKMLEIIMTMSPDLKPAQPIASSRHDR